MSLYDEIKSPFYDKDTLRKLVEFYANEDESTIRIAGGGYLYNKTIYLNEEQEKSRSNEYQERMREDLYLYNMDELYSVMKRIDTDKYDEYIKSNIIDIINENLEKNSYSDVYRKKAINEIESYKKKLMYPLSEYKDIISNYKSYTDFIHDMESNKTIYDLIRDMDSSKDNEKQRYMDELKKMNITEDEIEKFRTYRKFIGLMDNRFFRWKRCNGFSCISKSINTFRKRS